MPNAKENAKLIEKNRFLPGTAPSKNRAEQDWDVPDSRFLSPIPDSVPTRFCPRFCPISRTEKASTHDRDKKQRDEGENPLSYRYNWNNPQSSDQVSPAPATLGYVE